MDWKKEKPTVPGFYWFLEESAAIRPEPIIIQIIEDDGLMVQEIFDEGTWTLDEYSDGLWIGPLEVPKMPK